MKKIRVIFIIMLLILMPIFVFADSSVNVDKELLNINEGGSASFSITADNSAGKITIKSNDESVATVNMKSEWIENETKVVTVVGVKQGTTTIDVVVDAAGFDEKVIKTTYTISVNVSNDETYNNDPVEYEDVKEKYILTYDEESYKYCTNNYPYEIKVEKGESWGELCTPKREGYKFDGWYDKDNTEQKITSDTIANSNIVIYAKWTQVESSNTARIIAYAGILFLLGIVVYAIYGIKKSI